MATTGAATPTDAPAERGLARFAQRLAGWTEKWFPDAYVFALPLYNWGVSQHVKTWIDLAVAGGENGERLQSIQNEEANKDEEGVEDACRIGELHGRNDVQAEARFALDGGDDHCRDRRRFSDPHRSNQNVSVRLLQRAFRSDVSNDRGRLSHRRR